MNNLELIANADLANLWIAVSDNGLLKLIPKDSRITRFIKTALGSLTRTDYYQHIRKDRVITALCNQARVAIFTADACCRIACKIGKEEKIPDILKTQPRMHAKACEKEGCIRAAAEPLEAIRDGYERNALHAMRTCENRLQHRVVQANDKDYKALLKYVQETWHVKADEKGNFWSGVTCRRVTRALIPPSLLAPVGNWWRISIPAQVLTVDAHTSISLPYRIVYLKNEGELQKDGSVTMILEDEMATIKVDGTATFPSGAKIDVKREKNFQNAIAVGDFNINCPVTVSVSDFTEI